LSALFLSGSESIHGFRGEGGKPLQREASEDMAAIFWKSAVSDNWNVAADWSAGAVPTSADDVTIAAPGSYTVTTSSNGGIAVPQPGNGLILELIPNPDEANSLTFNAPQAELQEISVSLTIGGALTVDSGLVSLNKANAIGSVSLINGVLAFGNAGALGTGTVTQSGGELLATASETLTNALSLSGSSTSPPSMGQRSPKSRRELASPRVQR
jgi:hypothetical protein